jgi:hypothetical protein
VRNSNLHNIFHNIGRSDMDEDKYRLLMCSENNFMAADNLRSALTDLNKAYALIEQVLDEVRRQSATPSKES